MNFFHIKYEGYYGVKSVVRLPSEVTFPCVFLIKDDWDDSSWKTTCVFRYYNGFAELLVESSIKILQKNSLRTILPPSPFEKLSSDYISMGQESDYYDELLKLGENVYSEILQGLNDALFEGLYDRLDPDFEEGFETSLLRFSEAQKIFSEGHAIFRKKVERAKVFAFQFQSFLEGAELPHIVDFDFTPNKTGLNRIVVLIGKNGTGKTRVLANLANAMSGLKKDENNIFLPKKPSFSRVIAISYSVFDNFIRPKEGTSRFSYKYCGIREQKDLLTREEMKQRFKIALEETDKDGRLATLRAILQTLLGESVDTRMLCNYNLKESEQQFEALSSGQNILALALSQVVAYITPESLILYDEPELYLHPDAISALARALNEILEEFDSYAVVATHSPILLQETPSRNVRVFRRFGNVPAVSNLGIESFGENLTVITDEVFETNTDKNNYREHFRSLIEAGFDERQINSSFNNKLSFNAQTFLVSLKESGPSDDETT
jgi:predicted ATPase